MTPQPQPVADILGGRVLVKLADSVTTDHISPAGAIPPRTPAGQYLTALGVPRFELNTYASRRGNHEVMMRGCFANVRLRNQLVPGEVGGWTRNFLTGALESVYDAAGAYREAGVPLVVVAGKEYGSGSSRDWAAKGRPCSGSASCWRRASSASTGRTWSGWASCRCSSSTGRAPRPWA